MMSGCRYRPRTCYTAGVLTVQGCTPTVQVCYCRGAPGSGLGTALASRAAPRVGDGGASGAVRPSRRTRSGGRADGGGCQDLALDERGNPNRKRKIKAEGIGKGMRGIYLATVEPSGTPAQAAPLSRPPARLRLAVEAPVHHVSKRI
jgi:hypothetical protein